MGDEMTHRKVIHQAGLSALLFALSACAEQGGSKADQCQLGQGDGAQVGDCCTLSSGGQGICSGGMCTNGRLSEGNRACGSPGRDARTINNGDARMINPLDGGPEADTGEGGDGGGGADAGGEDASADPCADVVCDVGEVCDPASGMCRPRAGGGPAGACAADEDCPAGATCVSEQGSNGDVPGGFCRVLCADDGECAGGSCLSSGADDICFQRCINAAACRMGWTCVPADGVSICLPDCREVGCGVADTCNPDTGVCEDAPTPCRYECQAGEECRRGRCVRLNGTCVTDYHCESDDPGTNPEDGEQCHDGNCVAVEFAECQNGQGCAPGSQVCVPRQQDMPLAGGVCLFSCQADDDCPLNKICYPNLNGQQACYFRVCGAGPNGDDNGEVRGACMAGGMGQWPGTCIPLSAATPTPGFCFEAGNVPEGGACDAQNEGRAPEDRALQCGPGAVCFDDPDDPADPQQRWANRGSCASMCNPGAPACGADRSCINFGQLDDPNTPEDETVVQGFCLRTDCNVTANACDGGRLCRPYSLSANAGVCTPPGQTAHRQPCQRHADCAEQSFCGNPGNGPVCLSVCNPGAPACPDGEQCIQNAGWAYGICL